MTRRPHLAGLAHASANIVSGGAALAASLWLDDNVPLSEAVGEWLGIVAVLIGMSLALWSAAHLRGAVGGLVRPRLDYVVTTGPYRFVRHPLYLGTVVAMLGVACAARSWPGASVVVALFLPTELLRARNEEEALALAHPEAWCTYAARTPFFLPHPRRDDHHRR